MEYIFCEDKIIIKKPFCLDLRRTLDCGQAFRWVKKGNRFCGIAGGRYAELEEVNGDIYIYGITKTDFDDFFKNYFDLERDYNYILKKISENEKIKSAVRYGKGIRILNQEPFEALISFIISQNNNIPRIKGIIERLCENFGTKTENGYAFPSAETLSSLSVEDLAVIRSGFRAKYIIDAAKRVTSGEINLENLRKLSYDNACRELMKIKGVGPKVADCVLLYGLGFINAFPKDVWIKRALDEYFGGKIPECAKEFGGIAQQYIFYYIRSAEG